MVQNEIKYRYKIMDNRQKCFTPSHITATERETDKLCNISSPHVLIWTSRLTEPSTHDFLFYFHVSIFVFSTFHPVKLVLSCFFAFSLFRYMFYERTTMKICLLYYYAVLFLTREFSV